MGLRLPAEPLRPKHSLPLMHPPRLPLLQIGFYVNAGYFFTFFLICTGTSVCVSSLFRFLGCVAPDMVIASAWGGLCIVVLIITSGESRAMRLCQGCITGTVQS